MMVEHILYNGGKETEYVEGWPHLGNLVHANGSDQKDIINNKNIVCGQIATLANAILLLNCG